MKHGLTVCALFLFASVASLPIAGGRALAQATQKPNIVIIWGDDIGQTNSAPIRAA